MGLRSRDEGSEFLEPWDLLQVHLNEGLMGIVLSIQFLEIMPSEKS